jgi:uncharacterized protein YjiS (DUF1127 family)
MAFASDVRTGGFPIAAKFNEMRANLAARMGQYRMYRTTLAELSNLSTREMNDLGLNATTIRSVALQAAYK